MTLSVGISFGPGLYGHDIVRFSYFFFGSVPVGGVPFC